MWCRASGRGVVDDAFFVFWQEKKTCLLEVGPVGTIGNPGKVLIPPIVEPTSGGSMIEYVAVWIPAIPKNPPGRVRSCEHRQKSNRLGKVAAAHGSVTSNTLIWWFPHWSVCEVEFEDFLLFFRSSCKVPSILGFASFRFVGLVTSIASEQQIGKLHVPSWCFFSISSEKVFACMVFIYVTILFPETQRYFALGLLAINAVTDQQVQLMGQNRESKLEITWVTALQLIQRNKHQGFLFFVCWQGGGAGRPKKSRTNIVTRTVHDKVSSFVAISNAFFAVLFPILFSSIQPPPRGL